MLTGQRLGCPAEDPLSLGLLQFARVYAQLIRLQRASRTPQAESLDVLHCLPDPHLPVDRPLLQVFPGELAGVFGGELVVERLGVMVVDQQE